MMTSSSRKLATVLDAFHPLDSHKHLKGHILFPHLTIKDTKA